MLGEMLVYFKLKTPGNDFFISFLTDFFNPIFTRTKTRSFIANACAIGRSAKLITKMHYSPVQSDSVVPNIQKRRIALLLS